MNIGKLIRERRNELGLTLEEVGDKVGVGKSTVKKWEDGFIANMRRDKIASLAKALKLNPVLFIMDESEIEKENSQEKTECLDFAKKQLINNYDKLNDIGRNKLLEYSDDLVNSGNYIDSEQKEKHA